MPEHELTSTRTESWLAYAGIILLTVGVPALGITLAIVYQNPWWLWLIAPLIVFMEGGLFLIAVILFVVWGMLGV